MSADIILYAVIAAIILFWLKNTIGKEDEDGKERRQRPNPYSEDYTPPEKKAPKNIIAPKEKSKEVKDFDRGTKILTGQLKVHPAIDNKTAETGLTKIAIADKGFDIDNFLNGAKGAFQIIVEAFAASKRDTLKNLLAKPVYDAFEGVIKAREKNGETAETKIHEIRKAQIVDARLSEGEAFITVKFTAMETHVLRDKESNIIGGDPDQRHKFSDIWIFSRKVKSKDLKWLLVETRDDEVETHFKTPLPDAK
jgi:predicted lipid-binding transport protein (Tim44 family)